MIHFRTQKHIKQKCKNDSCVKIEYYNPFGTVAFHLGYLKL